MFTCFKNVNKIKHSLRNSGRAFISSQSWSQVTISFGLTVAILCALCFSTSLVSAGTEPTSPGYYQSPRFGYDSLTATPSNTLSQPVTTSESASNFIMPQWSWLISGILVFLIVSFTTILFWRRIHSNKH